MDFCNYKQYTDGMTTAPDPAYILFGIKHSGKTTQGRLLSKKIYKADGLYAASNILRLRTGKIYECGRKNLQRARKKMFR